MERGMVGILNVGAGDTKLSFDPKKPEERKRAAAVVADMLQRGFAILVEVGKRGGEPLYQRAKAFDPKTCEYLIVGLPDADTPPEPPSKRRGRPPKLRLAAASTRAVAVARSAGG
jgi:hypothetical protein